MFRGDFHFLIVENFTKLFLDMYDFLVLGYHGNLL